MTRFIGKFRLVCLTAVLLAPGVAGADPVADFYHGKTMTMLIGTSAGNDYDYRGRLIARFMGKHIPGEPTIVPRNMPGAGGVVAANDLYAVEPHDGTVLHMIMSNMMANQAMGVQGIKFDTRKFFWIGNTTSTPNVMVAWHTTGVTSIEQAKQKQLLMGAPTGTAGVTYVEAMNALAGTKFKLVTGYPGGNEVNLAMERGEVDGRASNSWASWKSTKPEWIKSKDMNVLVQVGLKRASDLADVPLMLELTQNASDRAVLAFLSTETAIARSVVTTPDTPPERVAALRHAFDETMKDPAFLAEAAKTAMDISPVAGAEAQKIADSIVNSPPDVVGRAKKLLGD